MLQDVDEERHDLARPVGLRRPHHGERRMPAVVERKVLEEREVALLVDQRARDVARERRVALELRDLPYAEAFVGDGVLLAHAEREGRVLVEEERGGVVVEAEEEDIGLLLRQPLRHRLVALEERLPVRIALLALVERHRDRGHVGGADAANDASHGGLFYLSLPRGWRPVRKGTRPSAKQPPRRACHRRRSRRRRWTNRRRRDRRDTWRASARR